MPLKVRLIEEFIVGFSSDLEKRLKEHNAGKTQSTKGYRPWKLLYSEVIIGRNNARKKEIYYKSGVGKEFLKSLPNRLVP